MCDSIIIQHCCFLSSEPTPQNNTFQGLVVTDGNQSYAVFIYKCGLLEWGKDAIIGFKADRTYFRNFVLSGVQANLTACLNAPDSLWKNLVYKLVRPGMFMRSPYRGGGANTEAFSYNKPVQFLEYCFKGFINRVKY